MRVMAAEVRRLRPDAEFDASPQGWVHRLSAAILGAAAHRPPLGREL